VCAGLALFGATTASADPLPAVKDNGFVTPTHEKSAGTVVFAKSSAAVTTPEKPEQFTTSFKLSEPIYFRAYLRRSLENAFRAQGTECSKQDAFRVLQIWVDGKHVTPPNEDGFYLEKLQEQSFTMSTSIRFDEPLNGKVNAGEKSAQAAFFATVAPTLAVGAHKLRLAVTGGCANRRSDWVRLDKPEAEGEITLLVEASDVKGAGALPPAAMKDDKLTGDMRDAMKREWPTDEILKVVIVEKSWQVETFKGHAVSRKIGTVVAVKQATQCRLFDVRFVQPAKERGFGATQYLSVGDARQVACEALK
jgi:hypothetical protein